jgi:hypothetical protein
MTAFLNTEVLRAHAAPPTVRDALMHICVPRPRLTAHWVITPDGRLACCWQAEDPDPH